MKRLFKRNRAKTYQQLEELVNKDAYQVFLLSCPAYFPFSFNRHAWFVINKKGVLSRWEILHTRKIGIGMKWGYLYRNAFVASPFQGLKTVSFFKKRFWKPKLITIIEDGDNALAQRMIETIENSPQHYPWCDIYILTGANGNTYVKWVLAQFPELKSKFRRRYQTKK
jgi:hypothetical protein